MNTSVPLDIDAASDLVDLSIQKIWLKSKADLTQYHKQYYYVEPVDDYIVKDSSLTAVKAFSKVAENQRIPADSPYQGFDKSYTQSFFAGMLRITRPMWRYGIKARKLQSLVKELRNDAIRFREQVLANPIVNAESSSYTDTTGQYSFSVTNTGGDGVVFASSSHTREDGGSDNSNIISDGTTDNMDFDYDAWKAARKTAQAVLGGVGETLDINIDTLFCKKESSVHHRAQEILKSIARGEKPGTADRDGSIDGTFKIVANPYVSSDIEWAVFDSSMISDKYGLQLKQGMPLSLDPQFVDYDTKEMKYSAGMDFAFGWNDNRNWIWSDGDNV